MYGIPTPKGKNIKVTDSANYRGIALCSIYGKIFDLIILSRYAGKFCKSELQFGFKHKRSTNICTMVLNETLSYYANNGRSVYCTFLDATKTFDRVDYAKLFKLLVHRMHPPVRVRLLLNMYTSHVYRVSWNGICSVPFTVRNGVKQGGVISPAHFCIYFDKLLGKLAEAGVGCYIGNICIGALAYADDIVFFFTIHFVILFLISIVCTLLLMHYVCEINDNNNM